MGGDPAAVDGRDRSPVVRNGDTLGRHPAEDLAALSETPDAGSP